MRSGYKPACAVKSWYTTTKHTYNEIKLTLRYSLAILCSRF